MAYLTYFLDDESSEITKVDFDGNKSDFDFNTLLNRDFFKFLSLPELRILFKAIFKEVINKNKVFETFYRCDSLYSKRKYKLRIYHEDHKIVMEHFLVEETPLSESVNFMTKGDLYLKMCSWCNKFYVSSQGYVELEEAIERLKLMEHDILPKITHGICQDCLATLVDEVESFIEK